MKTILSVMIALLVVSVAASAELYKRYPITGMQVGSFPTVAVYNACLNKQISQFDTDLAEPRIKPGKCAQQYPKYCNAARMAIMEDCVKCKHLSCPSGTYCDKKKRKCMKPKGHS